MRGPDRICVGFGAHFCGAEGKSTIWRAALQGTQPKGSRSHCVHRPSQRGTVKIRKKSWERLGAQYIHKGHTKSRSYHVGYHFSEPVPRVQNHYKPCQSPNTSPGKGRVYSTYTMASQTPVCGRYHLLEAQKESCAGLGIQYMCNGSLVGIISRSLCLESL